MADLWAHFSWMTFLIVLIAVIVVLIGGIAVIQGSLTFETYLNDLEKFALAVAGTAIGRGIWKHGQGATPTRARRH